MRYATAGVAVWFMLFLSVLRGAAAAPLDLNEIATDETAEALCDRLAPDPFAGFGPEEWGHPFRSVDFYRAVPACTEALANHPGDPRFALGAAMAYIAGNKIDSAKPLLGRLIAQRRPQSARGQGSDRAGRKAGRSCRQRHPGEPGAGGRKRHHAAIGRRRSLGSLS
jgi:hypothetical protein